MARRGSHRHSSSKPKVKTAKHTHAASGVKSPRKSHVNASPKRTPTHAHNHVSHITSYHAYVF